MRKIETLEKQGLNLALYLGKGFIVFNVYGVNEVFSPLYLKKDHDPKQISIEIENAVNNWIVDIDLKNQGISRLDCVLKMSNSESFYPLSILEEKSNSIHFFASYRKEKSPIMMKSGDGYFIKDEDGKDLSLKKIEYKEISTHTIFSKNFQTHWRDGFYKPYFSSLREVTNTSKSKRFEKISNFEYFYFRINSPYGCL